MEDCCKPKKEGKGVMQGVVYGLIPHTGCIAFILFTVLGVSAATAFFKPLLMNRYFFYFLMLLSFVFASISATIYLTRHGMLSFNGLKRKWKYLSVMYGTTIGVNILLFLFIFPLVANVSSASPTGNIVAGQEAGMTLKVDIPCPGHAPLISEELKTINGVSAVKFRFPNYFDVKYDADLTNKNEITGLSVFSSYPATVISEDVPEIEEEPEPQPRGCSRCSGCSGACGGTCGG
ncbi:hypothetical protein KY345_04795 [Candidatus Woesearchaeota archaeon]|nr:hypothetical protein [Candidatus Woesearchaeota archaeon]